MKRKTILSIVAVGLLAAPGFAADRESDAAAAELVTLYGHMQASLASDKTAGVVQLAALIAQKTEPCACGGEHQAEYAAVNAAALAVQGEDLAALREQFKPLSRAMSALGTAASVPGVQLYYCPMVKAHWLQPASDSAARNPYLGTAMPACGSKVEKLDT